MAEMLSEELVTMQRLPRELIADRFAKEIIEYLVTANRLGKFDDLIFAA